MTGPRAPADRIIAVARGSAARDRRRVYQPSCAQPATGRRTGQRLESPPDGSWKQPEATASARRQGDDQLTESHRRIRRAIAASGTSLTDLFGVGPIIACSLIGFSGDVSRVASRDRYAADNGTAPVERSSGGRIFHRVSQRGNRRLNHARHLAAICPIRQPHSDGRAYFDHKLAKGKTNKDAIRSLKRHISNAVYRQLLSDADRSDR